MFKLSRNLKVFSMLFIFYTIGFRYFLSLSITNHNNLILWATAIIYFIIIVITAWISGKTDDITTGIIDLGFKYHLMTYIIFNIIALLWHSLGFSSPYETFRYIFLIITLWGLILFIHLLYHLLTRKNAIKGIPKEEIFE